MDETERGKTFVYHAVNMLCDAVNLDILTQSMRTDMLLETTSFGTVELQF